MTREKNYSILCCKKVDIQGDEEPVLLVKQKKSEKKLPMEWISGHVYKGISTS